MEIAILLVTYAVIPLFCAFMVWKMGKEQSAHLDRLHEKYNRTEEELIDFLERRGKYERKE
jgi:hypothetical protein